jgi:serine/threonine protein kinase
LHATGAVTHPSILWAGRLFLEEGGALALPMRWIEGGSLLGALKTHGSMSESDIGALFPSLLDGARRLWPCGPCGPQRAAPRHAVVALRGVRAGYLYALSRGVAHRDIKPENILVDRLPSHLARRGAPTLSVWVRRARLVLADFGAAHVHKGKTTEPMSALSAQGAWRTVARALVRIDATPTRPLRPPRRPSAPRLAAVRRA